MTQIWFITGCSTGIGRALAEHLLSKGHQVAATARNTDSIQDLKGASEDNFLALKLDVREPDQIIHAIESAITRFGRIEVVVNNAGYGLVGALEGMSDAQLRDQMETNFFGPLAVTRAFLPHFRAQGGGRFIHISSVAGVQVGAGGTIYSASKFALEALSEGIAREGKDLNIRSTCIEPGPFRTDWAGRSLHHPERHIAAYDSTVSALTDRLARVTGKQKGDPAKAAAAIEYIATLPDPPLRLPLGEMAYQSYYRKLDEMRADADRFTELIRSADFED